jgi:hypothetical protein
MLLAGRSGFFFRRGKTFLSSAVTSIPALGPTRPSIPF